MFNKSNVSISISDEESDELARMRVRVRRKRKKNQLRVKSAFTLLLLRFFLRYWTLLIFVLAAGLLLFEATRIGRKPGLVVKSKDSPVEVKNSSSVEHSTRIEPRTRDARGGRDRCLKLLPPDELEHLDLPVNEETRSHVKKVIYFSENGILDVVGNDTFSQQKSKGTRFNLFTGYQTLDQREKSFKASKTAEVHCGFYSENGGFTVSDEDKRYMQNCKVVVSTCAFGGGDALHQPIGMSEASLKKESEGHKIGDDGFIGKWRIVVVRELPFTDQRLNGKIPKMLAHRLFPHSKYSIWVDSKSQFRKDPLGVLEALLWRSNSVLAISEHGARSSVYDEAKAVVNKHKATPEEVEVQLAQYHHDGLPENKRFNGKKALSEASVIVREHTPLTNLFMCIWFNEVVRFTSRDQLSFPYVLWRLNVSENINMFPVCTRKDLVNAMGHIRKAKPLNSTMSMF
ncbi:probable hexosyltransferase MUCI70 isoform X2 [Mangifera indica]|uniref:probable hexosyltransferase MUCI70 isoform X2 n=1 Tax=Mangifera indica TaxID=29780 RepID=UPI001CFB0755|nr:probable hexosyltransferase MUCI70 isoform X2 [Mangifera indica]